MNKYRVTIQYVMCQTIEVEAESPERARHDALLKSSLEGGEYVELSGECVKTEIIVPPLFDGVIR